MGVIRRRGRRRKKLLDDLKDRRGYCHLKEEALDRTMWRNRFGRGFGPVVRQNTEWMRSQSLPLKRLYCSQFSTIICIGRIVNVVLLLKSWLYLWDTWSKWVSFVFMFAPGINSFFLYCVPHTCTTGWYVAITLTTSLKTSTIES
jgi:hypothetical protein